MCEVHNNNNSPVNIEFDPKEIGTEIIFVLLHPSECPLQHTKNPPLDIGAFWGQRSMTSFFDQNWQIIGIVFDNMNQNYSN